MSFANPAALWGLLLLALPIVVHLFSFRTVKRVYFSNLQFLREVKEESRRKSQLKHLLLLFLRMAAIAGVVLAFAKPQWGSAAGTTNSGGVVHHSVFIDNSPSMALEGGEGILLEQAKAAARAIAGQARPDDRFQLITQEFLPASQRWVSKDRFVELVDGVALSNRSNELSLVYERQRALLLNTADRYSTHVYFLTDFQKSVSDLEALPLDGGSKIYLFQLKANATANLYVDSCWLTQPILRKNEPAKLVFSIRNGGEAAAKDVRVLLRINEVQKGLSNVDVPANGRILDTIDFSPDATGLQKAVLSLDDRVFPYDDAWYMQIQVQEALPLLLIQEKKTSPYLQALFSADDFVRMDQQLLARLDYNTLPAYKAVVLDGVETIGSGLMNSLKRMTEEGASLILIPADAKDQTAFNELLQGLGAGVLGPMVSLKQNVTSLEVNDLLYEQTFSYLPEQLSLPAVNQYFSYALKPDDRVLMRMTNGAPFLIRRSLGQGHVLILLAALKSEWSDFQQHALFVPTLYRAAMLGGYSGQLAYRLSGQASISMPLAGRSLNGSIALRSDQLNYLPEVRKQGNRLVLDIRSGELVPGHYQLYEDQSAVPDMALALNGDASESRLAFWPSEDLLDFAAKAGWEAFELKKADLAGQFQISASDSTLWKWLLLLVLVFLLLETLIIKFIR
ncbi:MAG: BatA domain-containing protein [Sphingobacteriaceae bacterium]|nr:BatA domain-containing protein [Sphingobacteriaceae bacterium]